MICLVNNMHSYSNITKVDNNQGIWLTIIFQILDHALILL